MTNLSDIIERKFVESFDINDFEIETDTGWQDIKAIHKTVPYKIWCLITENYELECTDTHIVFDENYNEIFVKDLKIGQKIITKTGLDEVLDVFETCEKDNMYDIELNDLNHRYFTDGILSHNTTTYTIFCLWYATLFQEKKIMICANKLQTALEIMDRIRKAYENLPFWIKPGILTYNKGEIEFANGSSIRATSTSSSAARGSSCNCVIGDTKVSIKDDSGNIFNCDISEVENLIQQQQNKSKLKVLTTDAWKVFYGVRITETSELYHFTFSDRSELKCTPEHLIKLPNYEFIEACNLNINDELFSIDEKILVINIKRIILTIPEKVYDLINVEDNHEYITNNVISHNCLMIDEMAFIPSKLLNDFFGSVIPIVSSSKNSKIVIVSTPNGAEGLYYDLWQKANTKDARLNEEGWKPFRIDWWEAGGIRDEQWKKQQIASIGIERWKQEYECDFLTSTTRRLVPDDILEKYRIELAELKIRSKEFLDGKEHNIVSEDETNLYKFTMWHEFEPQYTYVASGDVAAGGGGDSSVLYIWDISDLSEIRMCAKFESNKVSTVEFAYITNRILYLYNNPFYICERNGVGAGYIDTLKITYQYQNLVFEGKNNNPGVFSHVSIKSKACLWARDMLTTEGFGFKLYDKDLIDEMSTFVKKDTKGVYISYTALAGAYDDHIMAFIWLCYILQPEIIERYLFVCETFTSTLGNIYPKIVKPQHEYTSQQIKKVVDDPIYQDFLDFKSDILNKLGKALQKESDIKDRFEYRKYNDIYFEDSEINEPSWTNNNQKYSIQLQQAQDMNPNNKMPSFFIN